MKFILALIVFLNLNITAAALDNQKINEKLFHQALEQIKEVYLTIVAGEEFEIIYRGRWEKSAVNAFSIYSDKSRVIIINGGLARAKHMTYDGLIMTICHELGHSFAGAPRKPQTSLPQWSSAEAQSDYYASSKCAKRYFEKFYQAVKFEELKLPILAHNLCLEEYGEGMDYNICLRTIKASESVTKALALEYEGSDKISIATPDLSTVISTNMGYPNYQCRLDTLFRGAVCNKHYSNNDYCLRENGDYNGARPECWYKRY